MQRWNGEIEQLLTILFHFRNRATTYSPRDTRYVLNDEYELHYGRKKNIDVGGIVRSGAIVFAIELVEPAPQMMVYPNVFQYMAGSYRPAINAAMDHGWRR